eukprot:scaffold90042_cov66-Phaeocystis_antarctica.AAC.2
MWKRLSAENAPMKPTRPSCQVQEGLKPAGSSSGSSKAKPSPLICGQCIGHIGLALPGRPCQRV